MSTVVTERHRSPLIEFVEYKHRRPLAEVLLDAFTRLGSEQKVADELGVTRMTIRDWKRRFGIEVVRTPRLVAADAGTTESPGEGDRPA